MNLRLQRMLGKLHPMDEANDGDGTGGGSGGGDDKSKNDGGDDKGKSDGNDGKSGQGDGDQGGGQSDGGKKPTDAEAKLLKEVMQGKDKLKKAGEALAQANARIAEFDGIDPNAIKKLLADQKSAEEAQLAAKGEWDKLKTRMAEEHTKIVSTKDLTIKELQDKLSAKDRMIGEMSIGSRFSGSTFIADELTLTPSKARMIYGDYFDVQADGSVVGYDKPRGVDGRTPFVDSMGNAVGFDDALRKLIEADPERDYLLKSKVKPGAGSGSEKPKGTPSQQQTASSLQKISDALKKHKLV